MWAHWQQASIPIWTMSVDDAFVKGEEQSDISPWPIQGIIPGAGRIRGDNYCP